MTLANTNHDSGGRLFRGVEHPAVRMPPPAGLTPCMSLPDRLTLVKEQSEREHQVRRQALADPHIGRQELKAQLWYFANRGRADDLPLLLSVLQRNRSIRQDVKVPLQQAMARARWPRAYDRALPERSVCATLLNEVREAGREDLDCLRALATDPRALGEFRAPALQRLAGLDPTWTTLKRLYRMCDYRYEPDERVRVRAIEIHRRLRAQLLDAAGGAVPPHYAKHFVLPPASSDPSPAVRFLLATERG